MTAIPIINYMTVCTLADCSIVFVIFEVKFTYELLAASKLPVARNMTSFISYLSREKIAW